MKTTVFTWGLFLSLLWAGCSTEESGGMQPEPPSSPLPGDSSGIPEGYFVADFSVSPFSETKATIIGQDSRVQHVRYVIYKSDGTYVKEKVVWQPGNGVPTWPMASMKDTLPKGNYRAVFLANIEKTLFPYKPNASSAPTTSDVLTGYQTNYASARIILPNKEFSNTTEYYWANVLFSNQSPSPSVTLQRIIGQLTVHRNFVDAQQALNQLVNNIVTQIGYKNLIRNQVQAILPTLLGPVLDKGVLGNVIYAVVGGLDKALNLLVGVLVEPVTTALYNLFLQQLVDNIGQFLTGDSGATNQDLLDYLAPLLNPWEQPDAHTAIVTIKDFPTATDFALNVTAKNMNNHTYRYDLVTDPVYNQRCVYVKGFTGLFNIQRINVIKQGLVAGLVFDGIVDSPLVLNGAFVDVTDSLRYNDLPNIRSKADYGFLDLRLKSYAQQNDGTHKLTVSVNLGSVPGIDDLLSGIPLLGPVLNLAANGLLAPIKSILVAVDLNLPLLGIDNLALSGGWKPLYTY